jgi:hypothetical protein
MTNFEIADEVGKDYTLTLTGKDPVKTNLLREAIIEGIRRKLASVGPLEQRQLDELGLALYYVRRSHGTDGHHRLCLLAKFANLLGITLEGEAKLKGMEPYA